ncbi:MAG: PilZ domain-containing protein, partial [Myxococcota bacterium]
MGNTAARRRHPRVYAQLKLIARQDACVETTVTRSLGAGGLSFLTQNAWRADAPISLSVLEPEGRIELLARVVRSERGLCSAEFRASKRRGELDRRAGR